MNDFHFPPEWSPLKRAAFLDWVNREKARDALATGARRAETNEDLARAAGRQSGAKRNAQTLSGNKENNRG